MPKKPTYEELEQKVQALERAETERKQVEEALQVSEERLVEAQELAHLGHYVLDIRTGYWTNSATLDDIFGTDEDFEKDVAGWLQIVHPVSREMMSNYLQDNVLTRHQKFDKEYRIINVKTGQERWVHGLGDLKFDEDNDPVEMFGTIQDITEGKRLEEQLRQAQKMEAIGTLAGGIAHDFNNILGIIMGYTELSLYDTPKEAPVHKHLTAALKAADRARNLVRQILTFSRQSEQDENPLAIGIVIKEALKMLRSSLPTTIEIRQNIEKDTGLIMADPTQIHQIIMNLSTNASHAMGEKGGVLNVSVANVTIDDQTAKQNHDLKSGSFVKLTVSDTGHGIEPEVMERIFDPYFTTKGAGEGTGLGLSVIHGIVRSHNGAIDVHSEPGEGTTFDIFFPKIDPTHSPTEVKETERIPTGTERILLIDDEPSIVEIYQSMLTHLGYTVDTRTSSIEALEAFKAQPGKYDLIITDQTMPHLTGQMLAKEMMAIRPDIPIILCTGYSDRVNEGNSKAMGIEAFVMKPIAMGEMANTIRKVLD